MDKAIFDLAELINRAPQKDPDAGGHTACEDGICGLDDFKVQHVVLKDLEACPKYKPELLFKLSSLLAILFPQLTNVSLRGPAPSAGRAWSKVLAPTHHATRR